MGKSIRLTPILHNIYKIITSPKQAAGRSMGFVCCIIAWILSYFNFRFDLYLIKEMHIAYNRTVGTAKNLRSKLFDWTFRNLWLGLVYTTNGDNERGVDYEQATTVIGPPPHVSRLNRRLISLQISL